MFVARDKERMLLESAYEEDSSQFIAIYGRRRIGKTLLVREVFGKAITFQHAGLAEGDLKDQLFAFCASLNDAGLKDFVKPSSWLEAFELLKELVRQSKSRRKVLFIDELSWMDTRKSGLITALESFWNGWASARKDVVLIICASATSWMMSKIIHNKGGLYNRLTQQICLNPFTLHDCEELLRSKNIKMNRHQILEGYMILGGVPYYWDQMEKGKSLSQNIDALFFASDAPLKHEFDYLYASLFRNPEDYIAIVSALGRHKAGMGRNELAQAAHLENSGLLSTKLAELESCGFIRRYHAYGKTSRDSYYQLIDNFTLFYFKFLRQAPQDERFWSNGINTSARNAWCGLAFERVCLEHTPQILRALGVSGVQTDISTWSCHADADRGLFGSQIDLLISRKDQVINLCEMKYSRDDYALTRTEEAKLRHKESDFIKATKTKDAIHITLVTPYGLKENTYSGIVQSVITGEDLF